MSASRSRQKRKLEPISIEELAGATGMSGFCTFLTRDSSTPVPALDHLETGALDRAAPEPTAVLTSAPSVAPRDFIESVAPVSSAPKARAPEDSAPSSAAPNIGARAITAFDSRYGESTEPDPDAPELPALATGALDCRYRRRPRIRAAVTVQDGHSLAEEAVY